MEIFFGESTSFCNTDNIQIGSLMYLTHRNELFSAEEMAHGRINTGDFW
jgi:hypothetical protein